jgi:hypothetical protein
VGVGAPESAEEGDAPGPVQDVGEAREVLLTRTHRGPGGEDGPGNVVGGHVQAGHVAGQHDHADAVFPDRALHREVEDARHLLGIGDELAVVAALLEQDLGMSLLEEPRADLAGRDV